MTRRPEYLKKPVVSPFSIETFFRRSLRVPSVGFGRYITNGSPRLGAKTELIPFTALFSRRKTTIPRSRDGRDKSLGVDRRSAIAEVFRNRREIYARSRNETRV